MYHYIRNYSKEFPYFSFLHKDSFLKQIKKFNNLITLKDDIDFYTNNNKTILTFDDGLKEHFQISKLFFKNNIKGIFFINSLPLMKKQILDVHKLHYIFGKFSSNDIKNFLKKKKILLDLNKQNTHNKRYQLKRAFNKEEKTKILIKNYLNRNSNILKNKILVNQMFNYFFSKKIQNKIFKMTYLNINDLKKMKKMGMIIGSHTHSHRYLSSLSFTQQKKEILKCNLFLQKRLKTQINHFAFPYGDPKSWNSSTLKVLNKLNMYIYSSTDKIKKLNKKVVFRTNCCDLIHGKIFNFTRIKID